MNAANFAGGNLGAARLMTGRSVAAPGAGMAATSGARFAARPGFTPDYGYPYTTGYSDDPGYDVAPALATVEVGEGGSCATPVLVCRLYEPAPIGYGCSCTVNGGQARGVVQP
jgi:hypothetical protein